MRPSGSPRSDGSRPTAAYNSSGAPPASRAASAILATALTEIVPPSRMSLSAAASSAPGLERRQLYPNGARPRPSPRIHARQAATHDRTFTATLALPPSPPALRRAARAHRRRANDQRRAATGPSRRAVAPALQKLQRAAL